ncbi:uncharacterized protein LOC26535385 [Drosophila yakuba]|uniref:Uncharacterized protein n=1 Tax=Drosophila yakuba TaxID=7245 RepID=A0A0R1E2U2_DROYA|nr:uncharacterized protein LOC26535385 [Drosophila yakuba]KRK01882.1 uncharacterized protein Dyak_GE28204 [Drosophila yakuba]
MSFNCRFLLIILTGSLLPTYGQKNVSIIEDGKCLDCRKESKDYCRIEATGFSCYEGEFYRRLGHLKDEFPKTTEKVDVCLAPGMHIDRKNAKICCVWSPEIGCQVLLSEDHQGEFCFTCRVKYKMEYKGLLSCPCLKNEGSRQAYVKTLNTFMFTCLFTKLLFSSTAGL